MPPEKDTNSTSSLVGPSEHEVESDPEAALPAAPALAPEPAPVSAEHLRDPVAHFGTSARRAHSHNPLTLHELPCSPPPSSHTASLGFTPSEITHARTRYPHWWRYCTLPHPDLTLWHAFRALPCSARAPRDFALHWEDGCTFLSPKGLCRVPMCGRVEGPAGEAKEVAEGEAAVEEWEREGPSWLALRVTVAVVGVARVVEKVLGRAY